MSKAGSQGEALEKLPGITPILAEEQELPAGLTPSQVGLDVGDFYYAANGVTAGMGFSDTPDNDGQLSIWTMSVDEPRQGKGRAFLQALRPIATHIIAQGVEDGPAMEFWRAMFKDHLVDEIIGYGVQIDRKGISDPEPGFSPFQRNP